MDKPKESGLDRDLAGSGGASNDPPAPRARNRTVMLTPEITGQVRARLAQDLGGPGGQRSAEGGQDEAPASGGFYTPTARGRVPIIGGGAGGSVSAGEPAGLSAVLEGRPAQSLASQPHSVGAIVNNSKLDSGAIWQKKTPVIGFLVSYDINPAGDIVDLRSGRLIVTSEASGQGNFLLVKDESVSLMHAILRISAHGEVQVYDQLSEFGTRIKKSGTDDQLELSGDKGTIEHGDIVVFGKRNFHVCMVARPAVEETPSEVAK